MDPNEALRLIRALVKDFDETISQEAAYNIAVDLVTAVQGLDEWLSRGGFLPDAWVQKRGSLAD